MLTQFKDHFQNHFRFLDGKRLLLAVSGGVDSMAMADIFRALQYEIGIAHCNFTLRDLDSDADEAFVKSYADNHEIPFHASRFDTLRFASDAGISVQMAARQLRYAFFNELAASQNYDYILTAHHADDNLETFVINLVRGTGIDGLTGIPQTNGNIVRPMLAFSRQQIEAYAGSSGLEWREDSSNASDKYLRNKIRHQVVPQLKALRPDLLDGFAGTLHHLEQTRSMAEDASAIVYQKVARQAGNEIRFDLNELVKLPNYGAYLYHWLHGFGFTAWHDIEALPDAQSGKQVFAPGHVLLKDRDSLVLSLLRDSGENRQYYIYKGMEAVLFPLKLSLKNVKKIGPHSNSAIFVDAEKIRFPLVLRKWKEGDVFYPLGMNGSSKKVSKFFKDGKFSLRDKENAWLLCSHGDEIIWIVGQRADQRFYAQSTTTNILHIASTE